MMTRNDAAQPLPPATGGHDLLDRHGDALFRFALVRLRSVHAAEDAVQETLLAAVGQMAKGTFDRRSSELTWLIGILKNKIVDQVRMMSRQGRISAEDLTIDDLFDLRGEWKHKPRVWGKSLMDDPHRALERTEFRDMLRQCLGAMPPRLSRIFMLREADGMESDLLCKEFGITPTNLWALLHRARTKLRDCLDLHGVADMK